MFQGCFFFGTGHESTFTHIKWDSGFHGFEGDNNNPIIRLILMILILMNTFSSSIIVSIAGLGFIYRLKMRKIDFIRLMLFYFVISSLKVNNFKIIMKCFLVNFFTISQMFSTSLSVYVLRRHLMVWKIFAPRFVFDAINLILSFIFSILNVFLFKN